jgi:hypothetical protein
LYPVDSGRAISTGYVNEHPSAGGAPV